MVSEEKFPWKLALQTQVGAAKYPKAVTSKEVCSASVIAAGFLTLKLNNDT